jgi:outer membrane protein assembly factor BamB
MDKGKREETDMSAAHTSGPRRGRILLWLALALLMAFLGLLTFQKFFANRPRYAQDEGLMEELASATILDDTTGFDARAWPQWRGSRRDGVTTAPDLLMKWPAEGPKRLWRTDGGDGYSSLAVVGDSAYSMIAVGEGQEAVVCWNIADGKERWRHPYQPGKSFQYGGPRATPTIDGQRLYTVSPTGLLLCLNTRDGEEVWKHDLSAELGAVMPQWGFSFSPLVEGDRVFALPGGKSGKCLAAFAKEDGALLWTAQNDPAGYSSPVAATIAEVRQIVFFTGRRLLAVTPDKGKLLWEFPWQTSFDVNAATPEVIHARSAQTELTYVFLSSGYGRGCALVKIIAEGGKFRAKAVYENNELCCHFASPVRHGEHIYGLDETRDLTCLSLRTGQAVWRQPGFLKGTLLRVDDHLIVLGEQGKLALIDATPKGYRELAKARPFRGRCWTTPVLADGRLFLRDQQQVMCLDVRKPQG